MRDVGASAPGAGQGASPVEGQPSQQLVQLVFAHLSLTVLSFGIALALDLLGRELPTGARQGLYWTVAAAFATTVISGLLLSRLRRVDHFVAVQIATDVAIVTSLVHYSGGRESIFTFLYVIVTLYSAVLFERRGAMIAATLSAAGYGGLLFATRGGLVPNWGDAPAEGLPLPGLVAIWAVHVGALYLVGVLASLLSSELQRTGQALDQSTSDLRRLTDLHQRTVESIMSGLLTADSSGRITSFNPEAERITGRGAASVVGRALADVIPGASELVSERERAAAGPAAPRTRLPYRNASGDDLHLGVAASILRDAEGAGQGHVVIFQDVTDVVAMERELSRSERLAAVGEMAAKIAHEIRNPLASISGAIQILRSATGDGGEDAEGARLMDIVVRETDRLNGLITDFLVYSRPTPPAMKTVPVRATLQEIADLLEGARPEDVRIEVEGSADLCVRADPDQLRQILWNLAQNGVQSMTVGGGRLRLSVEAGAGLSTQDPEAFRRNGRETPPSEAADDLPWVEIAIADEGEGIPPDVQDRIFEPFFTTKREGTGLGLATVYRITESHGGAVVVESEAGVGTTFRIRLPGAQETQ